MSKPSAAAYFLLGLLAVLVVGGATAGLVVLLDLDGDDDGDELAGGPVDGSSPTELQENQVAVTGIAVGVTLQGSTIDVIDAPLVVTTPERGGGAGATLTGVEVDGVDSEIVWDAGTPFNLLGAGLGIRPSTVNLFANPTALTVQFPDGEVHGLIPGAYAVETPVAVGRGGVAVSVQALAFEANDASTIVFRGGATTSMLPRTLEFESTGRVLLQGEFEVRRPNRATITQALVELPEGRFDIRCTLRPDGTGYDVEALLEGEVLVT